MTDSPNDAADNTADKAHDAIDDLAPESSKELAHDAVDTSRKAAKDAASKAQTLADTAAAKAGPALADAKAAYSRKPRVFQILGVVLLSAIVFAVIRRTRTS
jgi:hypothetical protein